MNKFGISQPVRRSEDSPFLRGHGKYVSDIKLEGSLTAYILRSPHAHAKILSIDVSLAKSQQGVHLILTGEDYKKAGLGAMPYVDPPTPDWNPDCIFKPEQYGLATNIVRYVGDIVALVIAENIDIAQDAANLIDINYEILEPTIETEFATSKNKTPVWSEAPNNISFTHKTGNSSATDKAFNEAKYIITRKHVINRVAANSMEARGILASYNKTEDFHTIYLSTQMAFGVRKIIAENIFGEEERKFRIITNDVGGGFGMKASFYPEYAIVVWATRILGKPVKWIEDRSEAHQTDYHGRDNVTEVSLALDEKYNFLGLKVDTIANLGAYLSTNPAGPPTIHLGGLIGVYKTPAAYVTVTGVFTNTCSTAPYRGAGRPEASFIIETTIDAASRELGVDPIELRRINMIPSTSLPYQTPLHFNYDSGKFEEALDKAIEVADLAGFEGRKNKSRDLGRYRGLGVSYSIERAAPPGFEYNEMQFQPNGELIIYAGTTNNGQGHHTMYKQIACEYLGLDPNNITVVEGDTGEVKKGFGTGGSRVSAMGSSAAYLATEKIISKGKSLASHILEAAQSDIIFSDGQFSIQGTDRSITLEELATLSFNKTLFPPDHELGLGDAAEYKADQPNYPNGCHICEVEIDPETGKIWVVKYTVIDDVGTVINPLLLDGQIHGGVAQGLGQILFEDILYDNNTGQLLTGSFMDYVMPRSDDIPEIVVEVSPAPTDTNPLGIKGAGEAGTIGAMPCVMNAAIDALSPIGIDHLDMPLTPDRVWRALNAKNR